MTVSSATTTPGTERTLTAQSGLRRWLRKNGPSYLFILPALLLYAVFVIYPFFNTIYYSLTDWDGARPVKNFVGGANYVRLVRDPLMWLSLRHNLIWIAVGTLTPVIVGLIVATWVSSEGVRGRVVFRTIYFMPVVLASVVVGMVWAWIYHPLFGPINTVLKAIGLGHLARGWLGDLNLALYALLLAAFWAYWGFCFVILLAALQNVDMELHDAAKIDGANSVQRFINVTVPQLRPILTMLTAYTLIGGFNVFDIVYIMTKGGPANATEVLATYTYHMAFKQSQVAYGATLTLVITALSMLASYTFITLRERGNVGEV